MALAEIIQRRRWGGKFTNTMRLQKEYMTVLAYNESYLIFIYLLMLIIVQNILLYIIWLLWFLNWMKLCIVKPSACTNNVKEIMQELAIFTGSEVGSFVILPQNFLYDLIWKSICF